jgi:hypothetical protein
LAAVRRRFDGPIEIGLACGPGRSYGLRAGNPLVSYRPLREVDFPAPSPLPTLALLSDIGNDIAYAQRPDTTLGWVTELADRLERQGTEVVLTGVPVESLRGLPRWLFVVLRALYYAGQTVTQGDIMQRLSDLEGGLEGLARERGYLYLPTNPEWYGFDRFHLRTAHHSACWESWMERLRPDLGFQGSPTWRSLWRMRPSDYWYRGKQAQASGEYDDVLQQTRLWVR